VQVVARNCGAGVWEAGADATSGAADRDARNSAVEGAAGVWAIDGAQGIRARRAKRRTVASFFMGAIS
jgi:hypothetical protein